jgi:hypothetical protein
MDIHMDKEIYYVLDVIFETVRTEDKGEGSALSCTLTVTGCYKSENMTGIDKDGTTTDSRSPASFLL